MTKSKTFKVEISKDRNQTEVVFVFEIKNGIQFLMKVIKPMTFEELLESVK